VRCLTLPPTQLDLSSVNVSVPVPEGSLESGLALLETETGAETETGRGALSPLPSP